MTGAWIVKREARRQFDRRNRGDLDAFFHGIDDDVVYVFPGTGRMSGEFRGKDRMRAWFDDFRRHYPDVHFEVSHVYVENVLALGGNNRIAVEWAARLTRQGGQADEGLGVTVVTLRGGKAVRIHDFIFDIDAPLFRD